MIPKLFGNLLKILGVGIYEGIKYGLSKGGNEEIFHEKLDSIEYDMNSNINTH